MPLPPSDNQKTYYCDELATLYKMAKDRKHMTWDQLALAICYNTNGMTQFRRIRHRLLCGRRMGLDRHICACNLAGISVDEGMAIYAMATIPADRRDLRDKIGARRKVRYKILKIEAPGAR